MSSSCAYLVKTRLPAGGKSCACLSKVEKNTVTRYTLRISAGVMSCFWPDVSPSHFSGFHGAPSSLLLILHISPFFKNASQTEFPPETLAPGYEVTHTRGRYPLDETPFMNPKMSGCNHGDPAQHSVTIMSPPELEGGLKLRQRTCTH